MLHVKVVGLCSCLSILGMNETLISTGAVQVVIHFFHEKSVMLNLLITQQDSNPLPRELLIAWEYLLSRFATTAFQIWGIQSAFRKIGIKSRLMDFWPGVCSINFSGPVITLVIFKIIQV